MSCRGKKTCTIQKEIPSLHLFNLWVQKQIEKNQYGVVAAMHSAHQGWSHRVTLALATKINSLRGSWSYKQEVHAIEFKIEKSKELRVVCGYVSKSLLE